MITARDIERFLEAQPADEIGDRYCQITPDGELLPYTEPPTYPVLAQWYTGFRGVDDLIAALDPDVDAAVTEWHRQAKPAYVDRDPFGTRAAIEARKAPAVPPEVAEWQPGPWRWVRGRDEWVCGPFRAGEDIHGPYVAMPPQVPRVHGRTYAEAVDTMRQVCLRALGRDPLPAPPPAVRCVWSVRTSGRSWNATLTLDVLDEQSTIRSAREGRIGETEAAATYALQSSGMWRTLLALCINPERIE